MWLMRAFVPGAGGPASPIVPGAGDPAVLNGSAFGQRTFPYPSSLFSVEIPTATTRSVDTRPRRHCCIFR